ncbi:ATP-binding protein [Streptomyces sp. NPDC055287]
MNHVTDEPDAEVGARRYGANFTVGDHSARHLRCILRMYLTTWQLSAVSDAAELALTELVANVVRHVPGRRCSVLILRAEHGVRVEVADACARLPKAEGSGPLDEGGRGLALVEAVSDRWGVDPGPGRDGKTVWFECHRPGPGPAVSPV